MIQAVARLSLSPYHTLTSIYKEVTQNVRWIPPASSRNCVSRDFRTVLRSWTYVLGLLTSACSLDRYKPNKASSIRGRFIVCIPMIQAVSGLSLPPYPKLTLVLKEMTQSAQGTS
jgi:hypothetical protein